MKSKFYSIGLVLISLLLFSCSNDDFENSETQSKNFENKSEFSTQKDSLGIKSPIISHEQDDVYYGDPSNPKPPRR